MQSTHRSAASIAVASNGHGHNLAETRHDPGAVIDQLQETYARDGRSLKWAIPQWLADAVEVTYRNGFAEHLATTTVEEITWRHAHLYPSDVEQMVSMAERHVLKGSLSGRGIELGAGCGILSATVAKRPGVRSILALEVCTPQTELLIPKVARGLLGQSAGKVIPVAGTFDTLEIPDESLDFTVEIHSLHHSGDLKRTIRECARVLKPGGVCLWFDRVQPDTMTDAEVEALLDKVYSREFLIANAYPPDVRLTRRENGEHEYRLFEWKGAVEAAGLILDKHVPVKLAITGRQAAKGLTRLLPTPLRRAIYKSDNGSLAKTGTWLTQQWGKLTGTGALYGPKADTIMVVRKPA
ncbi:MAG: class I SAM-dependent methyltransferase [Bryobacteraceae bacterium]|nr:class I SAM-dependent methyltransferase [Bryobacteraceae bacterium]